MTYTKPEVAILGDAVRVIEYVGKGIQGVLEFPSDPWRRFTPAYDLDE